MMIPRKHNSGVCAMSAGLLMIGGLVFISMQTIPEAAASNIQQVVNRNSNANFVRAERPKIQIAILLDTSNSMDGLIDQARNQLWQAVNEFAKLKRNGLTPTLEVAVYEYGNSGLSTQTGYIRQVTSFTRELDQVSEAFFSLTTNGGAEYCGYVINSAATELQWSTDDKDIKAIFIAGNEAFTQGPVPFEEAINLAKHKTITVHTIFAGDRREGEQSGWKQGALLAGGNYMNIDANQRIVHVEAPQDKKIAELNAKLNKTYVPYGERGAQKAQRQLEQDTKSESVSVGLLAKRARSKASPLYNNANWDLVDAVEDGIVKLENLGTDTLPADMKAMDDEEKAHYVAGKAAERKKLKKEIAVLSKARDEYVAAKAQQAAGDAANTVNDALTAAIRDQGHKKGFVSGAN